MRLRWMNLRIIIITLSITSINSTQLKCESGYSMTKNNFYEFPKISFICTVNQHTQWKKHSIEVTSVLSDDDKSKIDGFLIFEPNMKVNFLPTGLGGHFKNLQLISAQSAGISEVLSENLKGLKELKYLDLYGNQIQGIKSGTFNENPKLERIILSKNLLKQIDVMSFGRLIELRLNDNPGCSIKDLQMNQFTSSGVNRLLRRIDKGECFNNPSKTAPGYVKILIKEIKENNVKITELNDRHETLQSCLYTAIFITIAATGFTIINFVVFMKHYKSQNDSVEEQIDDKKSHQMRKISQPPAPEPSRPRTPTPPPIYDNIYENYDPEPSYDEPVDEISIEDKIKAHKEANEALNESKPKPVDDLLEEVRRRQIDMQIRASLYSDIDQEIRAKEQKVKKFGGGK